MNHKSFKQFILEYTPSDFGATSLDSHFPLKISFEIYDVDFGHSVINYLIDNTENIDYDSQYELNSNIDMEEIVSYTGTVTFKNLNEVDNFISWFYDQFVSGVSSHEKLKNGQEELFYNTFPDLEPYYTAWKEKYK